MMETGSKYQFGDVFDVDANGRLRSDDTPKPQFTEEDLASARGEGQQVGHEAGRRQALGEIEALATQTLQAIAADLAGFGSRHQQALLAIEADAARLAVTVAAKLAPALLAQQPLAEVQALIQRCLSEMPTEPRLVIRVGEPLVDALQEGIEAIRTQSGFAGQLVLLGEPALNGSDCRVEWADGGVERSLGSLLTRIEEAIDRYCASLADQARRLDAPDDGGASEAPGVDAASEPVPPPAMAEPTPAADADDDPLEATLPEVQRGPAQADAQLGGPPADGPQSQE